MLEFTLLNHPIDCPICDKAGECILPAAILRWDTKLARNEGSKVRKAKVVDIGRHIVLDQERCILCTRCIRVCDEVAKQSELTMAYRGARQVLTTAPGHRLDNPYSLNTVDVCPVGALTDKSFRFARRVWELVSVPSICPGCATGCNMEIHSARGKIHRLVPRENLEVNKFWMCDEGRFTYRAAEQDRFLLATVSGQRASLATAVSKGARLLEEALARDARKVGVVFSAGATNEDTHALARLALDGLKIGRAYLGGAPLGWSDNILVSADKNPNTAGVERIVPPPLLTLKDLAGDVASGAVSTLLVLGNASLVLPRGPARGCGSAVVAPGSAGRDGQRRSARGQLGGSGGFFHQPAGPGATPQPCPGSARRRPARVAGGRLARPRAIRGSGLHLGRRGLRRCLRSPSLHAIPEVGAHG